MNSLFKKTSFHILLFLAFVIVLSSILCLVSYVIFLSNQIEALNLIIQQQNDALEAQNLRISGIEGYSRDLFVTLGRNASAVWFYMGAVSFSVTGFAVWHFIIDVF